jgi:hypothetical protein
MSDSKLPPKEERVYGKVTTMAELMQQASVVKKRPKFKPESNSKKAVEVPQQPMNNSVADKPRFTPYQQLERSRQQPTVNKPRKPEAKPVSDNWLMELKNSLERNNS